MKTFYEFMESVGTELANEIGPMGLTKERMEVLAPMFVFVDKSINNDPTFMSRLYNLFKTEVSQFPQLQEDFDKLDVQKIKRAVSGVEKNRTTDMVVLPNSDSPM